MFESAEVEAALREELARLRVDGHERSVAELVEIVERCQSVSNTTSALQTLAMAHLAAIEDVELEDGTVGEQHRGLGHQRLDAPALVSDRLGVSDAGASSRMAVAVEVVTRAPGAFDAMASGRLDSYRAGIVCEELREAPPAVCRTVVTMIQDSLGAEPAAALRRRVRRALGAVDAELVRAKAARARAARSLRRWPGDEPGVDTWMGSFPVEQARSGWAVVDGLARRYVQEGRATGVEEARADALMDLIHSRASGTFVVQLAVPAAELAVPAAELAAGAGQGPAAAPGPAVAAPGHAPAARASHPASHPASRLQQTSTAAAPASAVHDDAALVTVAGLGMSGVTEVRRAWLDRLTEGPTESTIVGTCDGPPATRVQVVACDAVTGALRAVESTADTRRARAMATQAYRPPAGLVELVRARDGRCRFPGCTVSAVFCDLDHVRPWPSGPTNATNLMCLCRRHHRIKQTVRWRVRIELDASVTWTDPTGRLRTTLPIDFLQRPHDEPVTSGGRAAPGHTPVHERGDSHGRAPRPSARPQSAVLWSPPVDEVGVIWSAWEDELTHELARGERGHQLHDRRRRADRGRRVRSRHPPYRPALTWAAIAVGAETRRLDRPPPMDRSRQSPRRGVAGGRFDGPPPF